jgi:hypothetical protein
VRTHFAIAYVRQFDVQIGAPAECAVNSEYVDALAPVPNAYMATVCHGHPAPAERTTTTAISTDIEVSDTDPIHGKLAASAGNNVVGAVSPRQNLF